MKAAFALALLVLLFLVQATAQTGLGNWYSLEKDIRVGKEYAQMVEQSVKLNQNPVLNEYVNRIGQNLVRNSDAKVPFTFRVIDSDEVGVIALPGGFVYVNTGLITAADEEAELAGVMSHEIAHVAARHATRQATRGQIANLASGPLVLVNEHLALPLTFVAFSRGFETEADYLGVQYMYKAGYNPQAFVSFFEKLQAKEKKKPGTLSKAFATHPQTPDRIEKTQKEIAEILPPRQFAPAATAEFERLKQELDHSGVTARPATVGESKTVPQVGQLIVEAQPGGVQVYLDDAFKGISSDPEGRLRIEGLAPGNYQVRLTLPGYKQWKQQITLAGGETLPVTAKLEPAGPKPLALEELEEGLKNGISSKRMGELVKQFGVDFPLTDETEKRLRAANADDTLLLTITKSKK